MTRTCRNTEGADCRSDGSGPQDAEPFATGRVDHAGTPGKGPRVRTLSTRRKWPVRHAGALLTASPGASRAGLVTCAITAQDRPERAGSGCTLGRQNL